MNAVTREEVEWASARNVAAQIAESLSQTRRKPASR